MLRKVTVCLTLAALGLVGASALGAQSPRDSDFKTGPNLPRDPSASLTRSVAPRQAHRPENIPVGIIYDNGVWNASPTLSSNCYGNQFNSASGMTVKSFSVTMMSFYMIPGAGTDSVFLSVFGPVTGGGAAPVLTSVSVPLNNGSGVFNTHTFGAPLVGSASFLAGVWYIGGDTVGLGTGTVAGQGHHGMLINDIVGTGFTTLPGLNALVGAATANIIPVELTGFSISDE